MHPYRTHTCAQLSSANVGESVRLSGWIHRKRDHGGVLFIDLRDHYGLTQIVADSDSPALPVLEGLRVESVVTIEGELHLYDLHEKIGGDILRMDISNLTSVGRLRALLAHRRALEPQLGGGKVRAVRASRARALRCARASLAGEEK